MSLHNQNTSGSSYLQSVPLTTPPIFMSLGIGEHPLDQQGRWSCNASVADVANSPPLTSTRLGVYGKKGTIGDLSFAGAA